MIKRKIFLISLASLLVINTVHPMQTSLALAKEHWKAGAVIAGVGAAASLAIAQLRTLADACAQEEVKSFISDTERVRPRVAVQAMQPACEVRPQTPISYFMPQRQQVPLGPILSNPTVDSIVGIFSERWCRVFHDAHLPFFAQSIVNYLKQAREIIADAEHIVAHVNENLPVQNPALRSLINQMNENVDQLILKVHQINQFDHLMAAFADGAICAERNTKLLAQIIRISMNHTGDVDSLPTCVGPNWRAPNQDDLQLQPISCKHQILADRFKEIFVIRNGSLQFVNAHGIRLFCGTEPGFQ
jgi:hypothetical protein